MAGFNRPNRGDDESIGAEARGCVAGHAQLDVEPCDAHFVERTRRGVPSFEELSNRGGRRFELEVGDWHAPDCRNARHLTVQQLVDLTVHPRDTHKLGRQHGPSLDQYWTSSGLSCERWLGKVRDSLVDKDKVPSCGEFANAATRLGYQVERLPKGLWERQHYRTSVDHLIVSGLRGLSEDVLGCYGCYCVCASCDDCSACDCRCEGCRCAKLCITFSCVVVCGPQIGSRAVRSAHSLSHQVNRRFRAQDTAVPKYQLQQAWHLPSCTHPNRWFTTDELVGMTFKRLEKTEGQLEARRGSDQHIANCWEWRILLGRYFNSAPSCWELAAAARRAGYKLAPGDSWPAPGTIGYPYVLEIRPDSTPTAHFNFPDAVLLGVESLSDIPTPIWDYVKCDGQCDCQSACCERSEGSCQYCDCECRGCYCEKSCVVAERVYEAPAGVGAKGVAADVGREENDVNPVPNEAQEAVTTELVASEAPREPARAREPVSASAVLGTIWKVIVGIGFVFFLLVMLTGNCR